MTELAPTTLEDFGWRDFFAAQLNPEADAGLVPARVLGVARGRVMVAGPDIDASVPAPRVADDESAPTVGDWVLIERAAQRVARRLERVGAFKRGAAGTARRLQLIAANVDTLFVVTSANRDFNVARLERYLALAREGAAQPVVVVTKADLNAEAPALAADAALLAPGLLVECLDARDPAAVEVLAPWCARGQTVALVGSSGVGKSTLINTLAGTDQATRTIRESDQRGRHSTTARSMHRLPHGGWLLDTPGMRALKLVDAADAIDRVFDEITELACRCRFADCGHDSEPGCAVRAAIDDGTLDLERLRRFRKLATENRYHSESVAERRARFRSLGKLYKRVKKAKTNRRGESRRGH